MGTFNTKKFGKLFSFSGFFIMTVIILVTAFFSADKLKASESYNILLGGEEITDENLSGNGWSFDPDGYILSLTDYNYSGSGNEFAVLSYSGEKDLIVNLSGNNTFNNNSDKDFSYGILNSGNHKIIIQGEGTLDIALVGSEEVQKSIGIYCKSGSGFMMKSGTVTISAGTGWDSYGIYLEANATAEFLGGRLNAVAGTAVRYESIGVKSISESLIVNNCVLKAIGNDNALYTSDSLKLGDSDALYAGDDYIEAELICKGGEHPGNDVNAYKYIFISKEHVHSFNYYYSVSDPERISSPDTYVAECTSDPDNCYLDGHDVRIMMHLPERKNYNDGKDTSLKVTGLDEFNKVTKKDFIIYTFDLIDPKGNKVEEVEEVGNYTVKLELYASDETCVDFSVHFSVEKGDPKDDPDYQEPGDQTGTFGDTLKQVYFPQCKSGYWTWEDEDTVLDRLGYNCFRAVFHPFDSGHYHKMIEDIYVDVRKAPVYISKAPVGRRLTYNEKNQEIVIPGEAEGGMIRYIVTRKTDNGTDQHLLKMSHKGVDWKDKAMAVNAGSYLVFWNVFGDYNHNNEIGGVIEATIDKAEQKTKAENLTMNVGDTADISASTNGDGTFTYKINSGDAVKLDESGKITAVKPGTSVIDVNVSETDNYLAGYTAITVKVVENTVDMQRLYNPNTGEHFYTASAMEKNDLIKAGWNYEGFAWKSPSKSDTPVYRLYNPNAGDHHYTVSIKEKNDLVKAGWSYEGVGWYSDTAKSSPVYRVYNPNAKAGAHHFTKSKAEVEQLVKSGWKDEGVAFYCK